MDFEMIVWFNWWSQKCKTPNKLPLTPPNIGTYTVVQRLERALLNQDEVCTIPSSSTITVQPHFTWLLFQLYTGFLTVSLKTKGYRQSTGKKGEYFKTERENDNNLVSLRHVTFLFFGFGRWKYTRSGWRQAAYLCSDIKVFGLQSVATSSRNSVFTPWISLLHLCNSCLYSSDLLDTK